MDGGVVVGQISIVGLLVFKLLNFVHATEIVEIVGVFHCHTIVGVCKVVDNQLTIDFGLSFVAFAYSHQIHIVVDIEAIDIVGETRLQFVELAACRIEVFELVFEDNAHVVEAFLDNVVADLNLLLGLRYLLEVVLDAMRVVLLVELLLVFSRDRVGGGYRLVAFACLIALREVVERESVLVSAAPVVLKFTRTPTALEFALTCRYGRRVVEIP